MGTTAVQGLEERSRFAATRWSVVVAAGDWRAGSAPSPSHPAWQAMGELAQMYWFPLYAYVRRRGSSAAEAEDLVQGFFVRLLEKDALAGVDRTKGKFRSFLLASLKNYLVNEWDKGRAAKRGGGRGVVALDGVEAEARYGAEAVDEMTPERVFERRWALAVLEVVLGRLRAEYAGRGQTGVFEALEHLLVGGKGQGGTYGGIAKRVGMTEGAVKVAAHRLRRRYRELLREEIGQTVVEAGEVEEEIRQLLGSL